MYRKKQEWVCIQADLEQLSLSASQIILEVTDLDFVRSWIRCIC